MTSSDEIKKMFENAPFGMNIIVDQLIDALADKNLISLVKNEVKPCQISP